MANILGHYADANVAACVCEEAAVTDRSWNVLRAELAELLELRRAAENDIHLVAAAARASCRRCRAHDWVCGSNHLAAAAARGATWHD